MAVILAVETSTQACSCALAEGGEVDEIFEIIPRQHAGKLLPMIERLMQKHGLCYEDLDAIAYGQGPGSFTGLRIASGVTQGIALGAGLPAVPVSTLASQVLQLPYEQVSVFSCLDARIDEVYWGMYFLSGGDVKLVGKEELCQPEMLPSIGEDTFVAVGSGLDYLNRMPPSLQEKIIEKYPGITPRASAVAELALKSFQLGLFQDAEEVNPVYLRDKVTHS